MPPYHLFLHGRVYEALAEMRTSERKILLRAFRGLANDPFQLPDFVESVAGIAVGVKVMGRHAVLYHIDHAVKEIKIVDLREADGV